MYGTSVDPLANIFAGLNYAIHRYGSLSALNRPGGYDNGGAIMPGWTPVWNGTGRPENVRSASAEDALLQAIKANRPVKNFNLNATVYESTMDVRDQFRRMEALELS
jgi:SLT domain-containing protein